MIKPSTRLFSKGNMLLAEQAAMSFFQFGVIFVLSKTTTSEIFSQYIVVNSVVVFCFLAIQTIISSPTLILSQSRWVDNSAKYFNTTLFTTICFVLFIGAPFFLFRFVDTETKLNAFFFLMSLSLFDVFRKRFIYEGKQTQDLFFTTSISVVSLISLLFFYPSTSLSSIFLVKALIFLLSTIILLIRTNTFKLMPNTINKVFIYMFLKEHFKFSKYLVFGVVFYWGYSSGLYIYLYNIINAEQISQLKAAQNLSGIFSIFLVYLESRHTTELSKITAESKSNKKEVLEIIKKGMVRALMISLLSFILMFFLYEIFYTSLYGNGLVLLMIFFFQQLFLLLSKPFAIALKSYKQTKPFLIAHGLSLVFSSLLITTIVYNQVSAGIVFMLSSMLFGVIILFNWIIHEKNFNN